MTIRIPFWISSIFCLLLLLLSISAIHLRFIHFMTSFQLAESTYFSNVFWHRVVQRADKVFQWIYPQPDDKIDLIWHTWSAG